MNNRGIILIFVLIVISFAVGVVLTINKNSTDKYENSMDIYFQNQASIYALTAIKAIEKVLKEDDNAYDSMEDDWAKIPPLQIEGGYLSAHVEPLDSKINMNNIFYSDKKKKKKEIEAIRKRYKNAINFIIEDVISNVKLSAISDEDMANIQIASIGVLIDWIDKDSKLSDDGDEEGLYYVNNDKSYSVKNNYLESIYELKYIKGFTDFYKNAKDFVTVISANNKININFAPAEVIKAYLPEIEDFANDIISYRSDTPFKDVSQIREVGIDDETYLKVLPFICVKSSLFKIKILVVINSKSYYYEALVSREKGKAKILKYIEGAYEDYF